MGQFYLHISNDKALKSQVRFRAFVLVLYTLLINPILGFGKSASAEQQDSLPKLLILDPVSLKSSLGNREMGEQLRSLLRVKKKWNVLSREQAEQKYREYSFEKYRGCHEFPCAFDAGNIVQAEYVLWTTLTRVENMGVFTFNLANIPSSKVVWSEVGEVLLKEGSEGSDALVHRWSQIFKPLDPADLQKQSVPTKGLLAILDLNEPSAYSQVIIERLATHGYASGQYDLMNQTELNDLLQALDLKPSSLEATEKNMLEMGNKLGVAHLIYSRLKMNQGTFDLQLALYDISKKRKLREWPFHSNDFQKLLKFENKFFSQVILEDGGTQASVATSGKTPIWKHLIRYVTLGAGATFLALSYNENSQGKKSYDNYLSARVPDQAASYRLETEEHDKKRNLYGTFAGVSIATSFVFWVF